MNGASEAGCYPVTYTDHRKAGSRSVSGAVPVEEVVTLYLNGQALVRLMCTPTRLKALALGFLFNEALIDGMDEVAAIELCGDGRGIDAWLKRDVESPQLRAVTSGCSGGTTFEDVSDVRHQIVSDRRIESGQVMALVKKLSGIADLYRRTGGIHVAALADPGEEEPMVCVAEDVGRHNALDKIAGSCLRNGRSMANCVLLTSGRISAEMVNKAARMRVPIVISRTAPTSLAVRLAESWGLTLIGYARRGSFRAYTCQTRVLAAGDTAG